MPKNTKRIETKRAARMARAHTTELPKPQAKAAPSRRSPGYKAPTRGAARYPWLTGISLVALIGLGVGIFALYTNHIGPFALLLQVKPTPTPVVYATVPPASKSPCITDAVLKQITDTAPAPSEAEFNKINHKYTEPPKMALDAKKLYCAGINTNQGLIVIELDPKFAPNTVNNFVFLAQHHFYDGLKFHRVLPNQIIQGGDPAGDGTGGPGYKFNDEPVQGDYTAGTIAMANSGPNTNGSQFFINTTDNTKTFAKSYNLFGHVVQGMDVEQKIQGPDPSNDSTKNITPDIMTHVIVVAA
jgi:cyclophilin family peptidyl-prolyl cis-trans isomerase